MTSQYNIHEFNKIYDKTYNDVLKFIICNSSNLEDANDILQETYLELYKKLSKNNEIIDIKKYLYGIAKNKIKKYFSIIYKLKTISLSKNDDNEIELIEKIPSEIDIEKITIENHDLETSWNYLKTKNIIIQRIFFLYYRLDLTIKEISEYLNISESYTKNSIYRTLKELKEKLKE